MAEPEATLSISGLEASFGEKVVFAKVSVDVAAGEVIAVIGPSGTGKSTFLRCINLLEKPTSGSIQFQDQQIWPQAGSRSARRRAAEKYRAHVGMVFQSFNLFPHLSALDNVSLAQRSVLGRSREEADERSRSMLERVGLGAKMGSYPEQCSGGEQQRIAIARALAMDPQIMLFDEATSALDPELAVDVLATIRGLAASGMTMVLVTHQIAFAREIADRVLFMADGRIVEEGPPSQVIDNPVQERTKQFLSVVRAAT